MATTTKEHVVTNPTWGNWRLERDPIGFNNQPLLVHSPSAYRVDFQMMNTAAGMIDVIFQVVGKGYSSEDIGGFIKALDDLLAPQHNLGLGAPATFNALAYVEASIWPDLLSRRKQ